MARQQKIIEGNYVRKETFLIITLLALAVGFFGGVVFAVFKSDSKIPGQSAPMQAQPQAAAPVGSDRIATLERQTEANPGDTKAWTELGNAYFDASQFEKSISAYRKSLELDPSNPNVWTDMGVQAIAADPKHEVSRMNKGIVLLHDLNDFDGAIRAWEGLLEVNPIAMAPNGVSIDEMVVQLKKQQARQGPRSQ
jgi:cytochrome c-type biogenesis protein CcmH/NrfG